MWADIAAWFQTPGGARVLQTAIIPAIAILVAGVLAAFIGRAAVRAAIGRADREAAASAVAGLVEAARAASEPDGERGQRRRAVRLRTEADVRLRLLPMAGAALAADWASARTDALRSSGRPVSAELDELRDRLIAWTKSPRRAKRIFGSPLGATSARPTDDVAAVQSAPSEDVARPTPPAAEAAPASAAAAAESSSPPLTAPAWQRTKAGERLQQERAARPQPAESARSSTEQAVSIDTAPVAQQHAHRAQGAPVTDADEAVRHEAQRLARRTRAEEAAPVRTDATPPAPLAPPLPTGAAPVPAWLDTYDDEAQVTQNFDLKTPPPVAAASVRDRGNGGDDLVPRS